MAKTTSKEKAKRRRATFSLEAPNAREVAVGGDFNKWNAEADPMKKDKRGVWKKTVMLEPGRYEYKFLVDGQWRNDPNNEQTCANCFGTHNNVLVIS
ncbi:MAG TPA: glycogen-binding domain-containing protein [Desulfatiglandales bacterium]|nr:glycogen-binding domain-containing protein [Desulfatiglandales bacterium]